MTRLSSKSPTALRLPLTVLAAVVLCAVSAAAPAVARPLHRGGPARHNLHHASPPGYGHSRSYRRDFRYGPIHHGRGHAYRNVYPQRISGGFSIGNQPPAGSYYFDPYCDLPFASLDLYSDHISAYGHPWRVQVIAARSGYPVSTYGYRGGGGMGCY